MRIAILVLAIFLLIGCASTKDKCITVELGPEGRYDAPGTDWFGINLGKAEGPARLTSCPPDSVLPPTLNK